MTVQWDGLRLVALVLMGAVCVVWGLAALVLRARRALRRRAPANDTQPCRAVNPLDKQAVCVRPLGHGGTHLEKTGLQWGFPKSLTTSLFCQDRLLDGEGCVKPNGHMGAHVTAGGQGFWGGVRLRVPERCNQPRTLQLDTDRCIREIGHAGQHLGMNSDRQKGGGPWD